MRTFSHKYENNRFELEVTTHKMLDNECNHGVSDEEYAVFRITEYNARGIYERSMGYAIDKPEIEELITFLQGVK